MEKVGIDPATTWFPQTDEATTVASIVKWIGDTTFGTETVQHLLPTLGVDGSLGLAGQDSPAKGKIWAKTGTKGGGDLATGRLLMFDQALAGYMQGADGHMYRFGLFLSHASYDSPQDQVKALANRLMPPLRSNRPSREGTVAHMGHARRRPWLVIVLSALLVLLAGGTSDSGGSGATGTTVAVGDRLTPQIGRLPADVLEIMSRCSNYDTAHWSALVVNMDTGEETLSLWPDDLMVMGSNMKLYTIGTALDVLGPDDQITTPVTRSATTSSSWPRATR